MRLRFHPLFGLRVQAGFAGDGNNYAGFSVTPTDGCKKLLDRFAIRYRQEPSGISLYYQTLPIDHSIVAKRPVVTEHVFRFLIKAIDPAINGFADIRNWEADTIYVLRNPVYNLPGEMIMHNGPLLNPRRFAPLSFKQPVVLQPGASYVDILDDTGVSVGILPVRPIEAGEAAGSKIEVVADLGKQGEGNYTLRHVFAGGPADYPVFVSSDYEPAVLAVAGILYQNGPAYTGATPAQQFLIQLAARAVDWFYEVYIHPRNRTLYPANQLQLVHRPEGAAPPFGFSVSGVADNVNGRVTFKSDLPISFPNRALQLDLIRPPTTVVLPRLPMPSTGTLIQTAPQQLASSVIVNI